MNVKCELEAMMEREAPTSNRDGMISISLGLTSSDSSSPPLTSFDLTWSRKNPTSSLPQFIFSIFIFFIFTSLTYSK